MSDDAELLRRYAEEGAEDAFAELVRRNLDLVYAAALRHVGDCHQAEEIAQTVFIDLARKAAALHRHPSLVSWLHTSTRFAALKAIRARQRSHAREQEAYTMQHLLSPEPAPDWERLRPILDEVLHELGDRDREIVLLRYFRGLPYAELAQSLRLSEGTARMRVDRALDKLSGLLAGHGIRSTGSALGVALATQAISAAPASLAASITGAALLGTASAGTAGALETLFIMSKFKIALGLAVVAGGLATGVIEVRANRALREQLQVTAPDNSARLQQENAQLRTAAAERAAQDSAIADLAKLQARLAALKARPEGVTDAELRPPQNRGRATAAAAFETYCWAADQGDLDLLASFVVFTNDSPEQREAFMANFSPALRARYRTPERIAIAAIGGAQHRAANPDPGVGLQILEVKEDRGPDQVKINVWWRTASGREMGGSDTFSRRADGWAMKPISLLNPALVREVHKRLDPVTGDFIAPKTAAPRS